MDKQIFGFEHGYTHMGTVLIVPPFIQYCSMSIMLCFKKGRKIIIKNCMQYAFSFGHFSYFHHLKFTHGWLKDRTLMFFIHISAISFVSIEKHNINANLQYDGRNKWPTHNLDCDHHRQHHHYRFIFHILWVYCRWSKAGQLYLNTKTHIRTFNQTKWITISFRVPFGYCLLSQLSSVQFTQTCATNGERKKKWKIKTLAAIM